jgi:branched-chain amino acid transport system ATP-binding protein
LTAVGRSEEEGKPCLVLKDLSKDFGGLRALDNLDLVAYPGDRLGIIGPNGAGKTTLFNLVTGALPPTRGQVLLFQRDITRWPTHRRIALGMGRTYQITSLFPKLTVLENVVLAVQGIKRSKLTMHRFLTTYEDMFTKARALLEQADLSERWDAEIANLSHGEQRQVEVLMALASDPQLLLLDEPTAGLSPAESTSMVSMLKKLDSSITVLIIEHDMNVAFELAERIAVLHQGKLLAEGTKDEVRANQTVQEIYLGVE